MDFDDASVQSAPSEDELAEKLSGMHAEAEDPTTRLARSVAKARIGNALFASDRQVDIGRYRLLERAGLGGMGVVWSAWDPELERRVAIKLVRATAKSARDQMQREGQALAKLSHPNVVSIFDVGVIDDQVYLVMEWVRGETLRALCRGDHSTREIVQVYRQVCAGLGAAHRAGVIHRDFKPENAVRGEDGRVRVLDFGLAVGEASASGVAGTPRYMAPEQAAGLPVSAAADQYACCTSLREALLGDGTRSIPRWLDAIVRRGTAADPAARFPAMADLAAALDDDPVRRWRRRGVVLAATTGVALAFAIGRARSTEPAGASCRDAASRLSTIWNAGARQAVVTHLQSLGAFGAHEANRLVDELTAYGTDWARARTEACLAYSRGELTPALYEQRLRCLGRSEASFAASVEVATEVAADKLGEALIAARSLPSPEGCASEDMMAVPPPPQAVKARVAEVASAVERSRVLTLAASPRAIDAANAAADAALATGYAPLLARATLVQGWARMPVDRRSAHELLDRAFHTALRAGDDVLAVEAFARAWFVASRTSDFQPSESEREMVEDLAVRTGEPGRFARALFYNNLATARLAANDRDGARNLLRQALVQWRPPLGDRAHDIELAAVLRNLALVEEEPSARLDLSQRAIDIVQGQLGPDHPDAIDARILLALLTQDPIATARVFAQTCAGIPAWHRRQQAECSYGEAWLAIDSGNIPLARQAMTVARSGGGSLHQGDIATGYLDATSGNRAQIARARNAMRALAIELSAPDEGWWVRAAAADAWIIVALAEDMLGRVAASTQAWQTALTHLTDHPVLERRRARVHATLAKRLIESHPSEARSYAARAMRWYQASGGYEADIAELTRVIGQERLGGVTNAGR